jgi:hypothetical protein
MLNGYEERFFSKLIVTNNEFGCIDYPTDNEVDRGSFMLEQGCKINPSRVAYILATGESLESDDFIDHHICNRGKCCNPAHLRKTDAKGNMETRKKMGNRGRTFTDAEVIDIRQRYANGESQQRLAAAYNTTQIKISRIVNGKSYTKLPLFERPADFNAARERELRKVAEGKTTDFLFVSGENNTNAVLDTFTVKAIRYLHDTLHWKTTDIARHFNVSDSAARGVTLRRNWKHVPDDPTFVYEPYTALAAD